MQLKSAIPVKSKYKQSLFIRLFFSISVIIIALGISLAWLINQLHAQQNYNRQTEELMIDIPEAINQLKKNTANDQIKNLSPSKNPIDFIMVSCDENYNQTWTSKLAEHRNLQDTCSRYKQISEQSPPYYQHLSDGQDYLIYSLPIDTQSGKYELLILKDAHGFSKEYQLFSKHTYVMLMLILTITFILLLTGTIWAMQPFRKMSSELNQMRQGKAHKLSKDYPSEFHGVSEAINRLMQQSHSQQQRYKNTIDDLAHSLKTRLSAIKALVEDKVIQKQQIQDQVVELVYQMDDKVQYHLRRALVGKSSLKDEVTEAAPIVNELIPTLQKIYFEKEIQVTADIPSKVAFPGSKDDFIELCGNILENAFRLCLRQIHIEIASDEHETFHLTVEDDGPGISDEIKQTIMERGVRADTKHPGNGIGLAICQEIILSYSGKISIEESRFGGAKIKTSFPKSHY
ncbi:GHKL domain-containing protein [Parashewanella spongiae]|uniref:histidine kinase n=1 Tax=Parashewanella spongiae TaxID=342950 RepID=A0A3A6TPJ4_9GAMM|nr:ATP-binding protein [Parashewanella spongiae]MCL1079784.1 ATP-binding protein [Parashewanella spongiae]RJY06489.1 GHKL domain-containing protein [Parashewanella spongiae]